MFVIAIFAMAAAALTGWGNDVDDIMRDIRYSTSSKKPVDDIVMVKIDAKSLDAMGEFPWPRRRYGEFIDSIQGKGVDRLAFDVDFSATPPNTEDNELFANAIRNSDAKIALAIAAEDARAIDQGQRLPSGPLEAAADELVTIWLDTNENGQVERLSQTINMNGIERQQIGTWLTGNPATGNAVLLDWSFDREEITAYSMSDIIAGDYPENALRGKNIIVGADYDVLGDMWFGSTGGRMAGARVHIVAANSIITGQGPVIDQWLVGLMTMILLASIMIRRDHALNIAAAFLSIPALGFLQWTMETNGYAIVQIGAALTATTVLIVGNMAVAIARQTHKRLTTNETTGIPNIKAMKQAKKITGSTMALQVHNQINILSELGQDGCDKVMEKISQMIGLGTRGRDVYQINANSFAWQTDVDEASTVYQVEAILGFMRVGVPYQGTLIDVNATIGMLIEPEDDITKAVNYAMIAATRAIDNIEKHEKYTDKSSEEHWKITVVSEVDNAIKNNNLWAAYQPKVNSLTGEITGAEALVRWEHPEKGNIRPDLFIPYLEKANRIDDLTVYMLERAMQDFSEIDSNITVSVNVAPQMLGQNKLLKLVSDMLIKHDFDPGRLVIEVTESESFKEGDTIAELEALRDMGIGISIDDYGTGFSTLNYLKLIPANEIKIDRSFVSSILENQRDIRLVDSTIKLAHELGMKVVAEGVETQEILDVLGQIGCDTIQGYYTGKPMDLKFFKMFVTRNEQKEERRKAA